MPTRRRHHQGTLDRRLSANFCQVGNALPGTDAVCIRHAAFDARQTRTPGQVLADFQQPLGAAHLDIPDAVGGSSISPPDPTRQCGFGGIGQRQNETTPGARCAQGHGQRTAYRTQLTGERELASELGMRQHLARQLLRSHQNTQCYWQIEAPALLGQIGWRQIDGDAAGREIKAAGAERRAHPITRLAHFSLG